MSRTLHFPRLFSCLFIFLSTVCHADSGSDRDVSVPEEVSCSTNTAALFSIAIIDFSIVNAATEAELYIMKEAGVIDPSVISNYSIRANEYEFGFDGLWVTFTLTGPVSRNWTERQPPYALFGDTGGDYNRADLPNGNYHLLAVATLEGDVEINAIEINFSVGPDTNEVIAFTYIEPEYNFDQSAYNEAYIIKDGHEFDTDSDPFERSKSIIAHTNSYATGSVVFSLTGPITVTRTENVAPYTLFGDQHQEYNGQIFPPGDYTITATPYQSAGGRGLQGTALTIHFRIADFPDISLSTYLEVIPFVDNQQVGYINDTGKNLIDLKDYPGGSLNLVAYSSFGSDLIGSVLFGLEGPVSITKTETFEPYALFGDIDYNYNRGSLPVGSYNMKITPYTGPKRSGLVGRTVLFNFDVIDTGPVSTADRAAGPEINQSQLRMFPNPAVSDVWLSGKQQDPILKATIYDFSGTKVMNVPLSLITEQSIDVSALKKGMYFIQIETTREKQTKRLVVH